MQLLHIGQSPMDTLQSITVHLCGGVVHTSYCLPLCPIGLALPILSLWRVYLTNSCQEQKTKRKDTHTQQYKQHTHAHLCMLLLHQLPLFIVRQVIIHDYVHTDM